MDCRFVVDGYAWSSKAGKPPVYKVDLKSSEGHKLTLKRDDRSIFEEFPKGESVDVKISRGQRNLTEFPEEGEE